MIRHKTLCGLLFAFFLAMGTPLSAQLSDFRDALQKGKRDGKERKQPADIKIEWARGDKPSEAVLRISATLAPGDYIYSANDNGGAETRLDDLEAVGLEALAETLKADHAPKTEYDDGLERNVEKYYKSVVWTMPFRIQPDADQNAIQLTGKLLYQVCNNAGCRPARLPFDVRLPAPASDTQPSVEETPTPDTQSQPPVKPGLLGGAKKPLPEISTSLQRDSSNEVTLVIDVSIPSGFYIFSTDSNGNAETKIAIEQPAGLEPIDEQFVADKQPEIKKNDLYPEDSKQPRTVEIYEGHVRWSRRFRETTSDGASVEAIAGMIHYQICGEGVCRLLDVPFSTGAVEGAPAAGQPPPRANGAGAPNAPAGAGGEPKWGVGGAESGINKSQGLPLFLAAAFGAGLLALLTPCVFPMVPITVSFFQKQSEKAHHRPLTMATVYCLGIVGTFTLLGLIMSAVFGPGALQLIANNSFVNLFIASVLVFFGLNLLGLFELRMPSWLLTYSANQEGRGGYVGVLFMALTFTLTSFTCTFAFVGGLLVASAQGDRLWPTLGLLAFSTAFALPFFFLALFPSVLRKLPRSGGWMNQVKVIMGLVEVGAAFKFFNTADLSWNGQSLIFDYHVVMSAWVIISIAAGLYLLGLFRLPHDIPTDHIGVLRFFSALSFLGFASYLSVGLFGAEKPQGRVWQYIAAFAAPQFHQGNDSTGPYMAHGELRYLLDFEKALDHAIREKKPLFLDFTGVNCTNCRYMEKGPMAEPAIEERLKRFVRVQLFTDRVPLPDKAEAERLYDYNVRLQQSWFGDVTLPSYVVIPPDRAVLTDTSKILSGLLGKHEAPAFAQFLDEGWNGWQNLQAGRQRETAVGQR
ncbi:MAG: cytochrome c biogenesis protein CcdA [Planctomycetales bacterium]